MQENKKISHAVKIILQYLAIKNPLQKCEVIFLMGGASLLSAQKAAQLLKEGWGKKIICVSLYGKFSAPEWKNRGGDSGMFHEELLRLGIKEQDMIFTSQSTNTLEEVVYGKLFLEKHKLDLKKIIVVSRPFHQRRCDATWTKQWPQIHLINCPADEIYEVTVSILMRVIGEIDRLRIYAQKGDISYQKIPEDVENEYKRIKEYLEKS